MDTKQFRDTNDHILQHTAQNYGMSPAIVEHQGVQSAEARELMLEPLRHLRRRQIKTFRRVERDLAELISAIVAVDAPMLAFDPEGFRINFGEPQVLQSEADRIATFKERQALGTDNTMDAILKAAVKIQISGRYPLAEAAQAHTDLESRKTTGSLVLVP